jgi:predicted Zn-dependent peptidase
MKTVPAHVPATGKARPFKVPPFADRTLGNGLRVVAIRRPTVPRVEAILRAPAGIAYDRGDGARARMLRETLLSGTRERSALELARELQRLGASLDASTDADDLFLHGGTLSANTGAFLDLMAEVVTEPAFPTDEVAVARERLAQEIVIALSQPQNVANEALRERMFGRHTYGRPIPSPEAVKRMGPAPIKRFHGEHVLPRGATLVLVGDLQPASVLDRVAEAFKPWKKRPGPVQVSPPPASPAHPALVVDRPGSVQTNIRLGGPALPRSHPDFYKLSLAVMVFGGYFSSRLVKNIREDKGYTYSPRAAVSHNRACSTFSVAAEVGTEVTAPALVEIDYELRRMVAQPVPQEELDGARRYLAGVTSLSVATQSGLASQVDALLAAGLTLDYLRELRSNLDRVTTADVRDAAARYLAPKGLQTVLVGDAGATAAAVGALIDLEVRNIEK